MKIPSKKTITITAVMVTAIIIGLWSFLFFGVLTLGSCYSFILQGEPNFWASDPPYPILPPMSIFGLLRGLVPGSIGLVASVLYVVLPLLYFNGKKFLGRAFFIAAISEAVTLICVPLLLPHLLSLETTALLIFGGPFVFSEVFSITGIYLLRTHKFQLKQNVFPHQ